MRLHRVAVLAAVALLACVDIVSATISSKIRAHNFEAVSRSVAENRNDVLPTRLLRTTGNDLLDDEDRIFGLEKVSQAISSAKTKYQLNQNIRTWMKEGKNADDAFKLLQLDTRLDHVLSSKNIKYWSKFISSYNAKNRDNRVSMIDLLTKRFGEAGVSKMLILAKKSKDTEQLATKLQAAQVAGWINKGTSPRAVFRILELRDPRNNPLASRNLEAFTNYLSVLNSRNPGKETTLLQIFTSEKKLVDWLEAARHLSGAAAKGDELEAALFMKWFKKNLTTGTVWTDVLKRTNSNWLSYAPVLNRYEKFRANELAKVRADAV